jgi:peptidoglycan/LPS O-acetylase OafA/YrhL
MPRQRLDQVDAMRPMKQAGVISTHVLTYFVPVAASVSTGAVMLLTHFSREGFFFISACMLTYGYMDLGKSGLRRFYGRRLLSVAVPYLCWSVIYFLYLLPTAHYASTAGALVKFAEELATGYYQLYFLVIIMQYYLVFPLLVMFLRRTRDHHGAIVVIAALGHVALMTLLHWTIVPVLRTGWFEEFTPYAFYLIAGSIAAFHLDAVNEWLLRHVRLVIALTGAAALFAEAVYFLAEKGVTTVLGSGNDPFQPSVIPFDVGAIACLYLLGVVLVKPGRSRRLRTAVRIGSDNSYGVYLTQMLFINALIWTGWARLDSVVWWPLLCAGTVVIVFLAGVALTGLLARTPLAVPLTGRQRQPWARPAARPANGTAATGRRPEPVAAADCNAVIQPADPGPDDGAESDHWGSSGESRIRSGNSKDLSGTDARLPLPHNATAGRTGTPATAPGCPLPRSGTPQLWAWETLPRSRASAMFQS